MEYTVTLLIFIGISLYAVVAHYNAGKNNSRPSRVLEQDDAEATVVPFDRQSATPLPSRPVLRGYARIIDGDTIVIKKNQIRLFGIDAPEINHPYGQKAKWALVSLCKRNTVAAEIMEFDDHGRTVALCTLPDGRDLSAEMVKLGLAIDWSKFSGGVYRSFEVPGVRKKLWLADARQRGRLDVWKKFDAYQQNRNSGD